MATVSLSRHECTTDALPPVCASCGRPATERVLHTFTWKPPARERTAGEWLGHRSVSVRLPLCADDARHTRWKNRSVLLILLVFAMYLGGSSYVLWSGMARELGLPFAALFILLTVLLLLTCFLQKQCFPDEFRAIEITDQFVTLRGVDRHFADVVEGRAKPPTTKLTEPPTTEPGSRTEVTLTEAEYVGDLLPSVCPRCGQPSEDRVPRRVRITPQAMSCLWAVPLVVGFFLLPPLFVAILLAVSRRVEVRLAICPDHARDWIWFDRVSHWVFIPIWLVVPTVLTTLAFLEPDSWWAYACGSVIAVVTLMLIERWITRHAVLAISGDGTDVRLRRVHPAFVAALTELRERNRPELPERPRHVEDEWDDYDDEALDPPRRRRAQDRYEDDDPRSR